MKIFVMPITSNKIVKNFLSYEEQDQCSYLKQYVALYSKLLKNKI